MSIEAMRQALEALADPWKSGPDGVASAITALRAAIKQAEKQGRHWCTYCRGNNAHNCQFNTTIPRVHTYVTNTTAPALRQKQYDQTLLELCEECGWRALIPGDGCLVCARQKAKPVAWMYDFLSDSEVIRDWVTQSQEDIKREHGFNVRPLYTAPRKWVGLTDEEVHEGFCHVEYETPNDWNTDPDDWCQQFARYLEAKLKEKNT